jgi:hypothetical protein
MTTKYKLVTLSCPRMLSPLPSLPARAQTDDTKSSAGAAVAKVGGLVLVLGLALLAVASTQAGQGAYGDVVTSALGAEAADVTSATAVRAAASTTFAKAKKASLTAADAATTAEAAADAADAKAKSARDKADPKFNPQA